MTPHIPPRRLHRTDPEQNAPTSVSPDADPGENLRPTTLEGLDAWNNAVDTLAKAHANSLSFCPVTTPHVPGRHRVSFDDTAYKPSEVHQRISDAQGKVVSQDKPFHKWMKTLHRRAASRAQNILNEDQQAWCMNFSEEHATRSRFSTPRSSHRRGSSSDSSFGGFVSAVKSAGSSLANVSLLTKSRRNTLRSRHTVRTDRSSKASVSAPRRSEESGGPEAPTKEDEPTMERALQRRKILEELISTEESYIGDIRFLMNVYVTILASLPTVTIGLRSSINQNLNDIVQLHEEILGDLHRVVPHSEYTQLDLPLPITKAALTNSRAPGTLHSMPESEKGLGWLSKIPGMVADPQVAAEVARVFGKKVNRFFIYEEYGAKYEMMIKDVASAHETIPHWDTYQRGLETLALSLGSVNSTLDNTRKSLTISDLLVKPIQRICKYPLLFSDLLKHTPVCDCPNSNMEVENTLFRLREAAAEINRATDDNGMKATLEKTWLLQDRLIFPGQRIDAASKTRIRSFGHVVLCGALHICWQMKDGVNGQYMICLLYPECLCLATASKADQIYTIQACIGRHSIRVEDIDNSRGLQCHSAPFSWKILFESDYQLYELVMTACNRKEESEWRTSLEERTVPPGLLTSHKPPFYSSLNLEVKPLGTVFGKPGTVARRLSLRRTTTVGPKSPLSQVIIKGTSVAKESPALSTINRSQSLLTTNGRVSVLAPARGERARLEALLSDVWTRDNLPFPGVTVRARNENIVRSSASSMIRKLSVASIASTFTKRSGSIASIKTKADSDGESGEGYKARKDRGRSSVSSRTWDSEESVRSRLSVIHDVSDRHTSGSALHIAFPGAMPETNATGTVVRRRPGMPATFLDADWVDNDGLLGTPALRISSARSIRSVCSMNDGGQLELCLSVKENMKASRKLSSKWIKAQVLPKGIVSHGLRNFFR
ncbi:Round spore [Zalerion maritima]|uniref:Round spore n=1 Tax=Zalerion maritima TaxID=339359 RepID=A0AAD5RPZ6_9PEZI|nr:Round spore [Zalerion maritima]